MKMAIVFSLMALTVSTSSFTAKTLRENIDEEWESFKVGAEKRHRKKTKIYLIIVMFFFFYLDCTQ